MTEQESEYCKQKQIKESNWRNEENLKKIIFKWTNKNSVDK